MNFVFFDLVLQFYKNKSDNILSKKELVLTNIGDEHHNNLKNPAKQKFFKNFNNTPVLNKIHGWSYGSEELYCIQIEIDSFLYEVPIGLPRQDIMNAFYVQEQNNFLNTLFSGIDFSFNKTDFIIKSSEPSLSSIKITFLNLKKQKIYDQTW